MPMIIIILLIFSIIYNIINDIIINNTRGCGLCAQCRTRVCMAIVYPLEFSGTGIHTNPLATFVVCGEITETNILL